METRSTHTAKAKTEVHRKIRPWLAVPVKKVQPLPPLAKGAVESFCYFLRKKVKKKRLQRAEALAKSKTYNKVKINYLFDMFLRQSADQNNEV
nr:hypothetical protein [uncultured Pedobacter sp.]